MKALAFASIVLLARSSSAAPTETLAIEHARIHAGDGKAIEDGTLVVRNGAVAALGPAASVTIPAGARRIDGKGLWLTPGLIDAESSTGLADVYMEKSTVEIALDDSYDAIRAAYQVVDGFNPRAAAIPTTRLEGVTGTVIVPGGGLISGRGAAVRLYGTRVPDMVVRSPVAVYAQMGAGGREAGWGTHGGQLMRLRELLDDVRQYARRRGDFERNQMRKVAASRLDLEALIPVVEGRLPLVVEVNRAADIQAMLRLGREEKLDLILTGVEEGWLVAADLAAAKVPVIVSAAQQPARAVRIAVGPPGQRRPAGQGRGEAGAVPAQPHRSLQPDAAAGGGQRGGQRPALGGGADRGHARPGGDVRRGQGDGRAGGGRAGGLRAVDGRPLRAAHPAAGGVHRRGGDAEGQPADAAAGSVPDAEGDAAAP